MEKKALVIPSVSIIIIFLDQLTKILIEKNFIQNISIIGDFLQISFVKNSGSIFGLFPNQNALLVWFSIIVIGLILFFYDKIPKRLSIQLFVAFLLAGVIGNLIDRFRLGYVIDFIDFRFWPTFNLADSALTIGIIGLMIYTYKKQ